MPGTKKSVAEQLGAILKRWQDRLIDVSKSNPLLGLNRSRAAKLEVEASDFTDASRILLSENGRIELPFVQKKAKKTPQPDEETIVDKEEYIFHEGDINFVYQNLGDLRRKTRKIYDTANTTLSERGLNTLFLAVGCLEWEDGFLGKSESPLIMIPCEFEYKGASKPLSLVMADEDVILNPAIRYYLKEREEIDLPEVPEDFDFDKIDLLLQSVEQLVKVNNWKVTKRAWLGIFSFESLAIYQDLKILDAQARENGMVQAIAHLSDEAVENLHLDTELDSLKTPDQVPIPVVKADSSQLRAITLAAQGANIVIHGPPGTGKSQTITGIISNALAQKKKVLFVSSKMAALNVVHSRLQDIGLGQYCLEAHGVKSGKRKVIDELKRTFESNEDIKVARNLDDDLVKMIEGRRALNEYVKVIHDKKNPLSISVYNAYGLFEKLSETPLVQGLLPWDDVLQVTLGDLEQAEDILREASDNATLFATRNSHPLRGLKSGGINLSTQEKIERYLQKLVSFCVTAADQLSKFSNLIKTPSLSIGGLFSSTDFFEVLSKIDQLPSDWNNKSVSDLSDKLKEILGCLEIHQKKEASLKKLRTFSSGAPQQVLEVVEKHLQKYPNWYSRISLRYFDDKKQCEAVLDKIGKLKSPLLHEARGHAHDFLKLEAEFTDEVKKLALEELNTSGDIFEDLVYCQRKFEAAVSFKKWIEVSGVTLVKQPVFNTEISNDFSALVDILRNSKQDISDVVKELLSFWPEGLLAKIVIDADMLYNTTNATKLVLASFNQAEVRNSQTISRITDRCKNAGLLAFVDTLTEEHLLAAPEVFKKRFYSLWIDAAIHSKKVLSEFSGSSQADLINKYKALDQRVTQLNLLNTIAGPAQAARAVKDARPGFGDSTGVGILRKEMEKKKRLKPLRVLFNEIPQVLQALKPCFLMSPLSVSTFLKPGAFNFDLVIFDEASQLPTPEAIPSILRAKQVVVAGDSNQLPPTSFFRTSIEDDSNIWEEGQIDELESLLDDCKASVPFFQETYLKWHYRSRDERLINFSNHYYYENGLVTFPSPSTDPMKSGVILEYIPDGVWDRGGSRINRKEARRVAKLVIEQLKSDPEKTLGVVAFNSSQKEAIEDALEEEMQSHKGLQALLDPEKPEAFFIKSLENVQGDERDVIIISVGYGKAQDGKMSLNFGPLNNAGGWRRLNVLVTRAKWKTILVTSVRSSELVGINPDSKGPLGLKNYIQYAEVGFLNENKEAAKLLAEETNDFEDSVQRVLELNGFKVDAQVGVGSFRIDLAVRDPKNPLSYAIGIECDGATYHSSRSARDRDILRQEILQGMGWKLHRVWSTEWFKNKEATIAILIDSVKRAIKGPAVVAHESPESEAVHLSDDDSTTPPSPRKTQSGTEYKKSNVKCKRDVIMDEDRTSEFSDVLAGIVKDEGPIHSDLVLERIRELSGVARVGANIQANFKAAIKEAVKCGEIEKKKEDKDFLHKPGKAYSAFRTHGDGVERRLDQISKIEIGNAINFLIKDQFGLAYDHAVQSVKNVFGISRIDTEDSDRVKDLIDEMVASGLIVRHGPLLQLVIN